jgi:hypothetical protein
MKLFSRIVAIGALLLLGAVPARAEPLLPGQTINPVPGGGASTFTIPSGSHIVANGTLNYAFSSGGTTYMGTLREEVVKLSSGTLDFLYQFTATGSNPPNQMNGPSSVTLNAFNGVSTDVSQAQKISGPGVTFGTGKADYTSASRSTAPGTSITFDMASALNPKTSPAYTIVVATNATSFDNKGTATAPGFTGTLQGVYEALPAPEPATLILWAGVFGGMALVGAIRARRKKAPSTVA